MSTSRRHPDWLKVSIPGGSTYKKIKKQLRNLNLHTICEEAKCPNLSECFKRGTATFLILGNICTRNCKYCNVAHGIPKKVNFNEAEDIAESVHSLHLSHVVLTSVTRDDLKDGGAGVFADTISAIRKKNPNCTIEVLIPDFQGNKKAIQTVLSARPDVLNHNIEVVKELFIQFRPEGNYQNSINLLKYCKQIDSNIITKSGFMVGLGETLSEIKQLLHELRTVQVDILTIGQYLQPSKYHIPIKKYYNPDDFNELRTLATNIGFSYVEAGPLVRSSYNAEYAMKKV